MKMYFDSDRAFNFLKENQHVFTLRDQRKSDKPLEKVEIWRQGKFAGLEGFKVRVDNLPETELHYLEPQIVQNSGFPSLTQWMEEAFRLSGHHNIWTIYFVYVGDVISQMSVREAIKA